MAEGAINRWEDAKRRRKKSIKKEKGLRVFVPELTHGGKESVDRRARRLIYDVQTITGERPEGKETI